MGQGAVCVSSTGWTIKGEQEAAADYQPLWVDARRLVERFTNTTDIIVQQPTVELRGSEKKIQRMCTERNKIRVTKVCLGNAVQSDQGLGTGNRRLAQSLQN